MGQTKKNLHVLYPMGYGPM